MNSKSTDETSPRTVESSSGTEQKHKSEKAPKAHAVFKEPKSRTKQDLSGALAHLRSEARETTNAYLANLERDIVKLTDFVHDCQSGKRKNGAAKRISQIKEVLDGLDVQPRRGRRKDLKRIERAVAAMIGVTD